MLPTVQIQHFLQIFESWKSSYVHVNVAFIAFRKHGSWALLSARVEFSPLEFIDFPDELIETSQLYVGQILERMTTEELTDFMANLQLGKIKLKQISVFFQIHKTYQPTYLPRATSRIISPHSWRSDANRNQSSHRILNWQGRTQSYAAGLYHSMD